MDIQYVYPSPDQKVGALDPRTATGNQASLISGGDVSFKDFLDIINPLQQLPIIGNLYRAATGDTISTGARLAGGMLLGGPIGFMVAALAAGFESATGNGIGETMLAALSDGSDTERQYALAAYRKTNELG